MPAHPSIAGARRQTARRGGNVLGREPRGAFVRAPFEPRRMRDCVVSNSSLDLRRRLQLKCVRIGLLSQRTVIGSTLPVKQAHASDATFVRLHLLLPIV
jgi:hypothetical protein